MKAHDMVLVEDREEFQQFALDADATIYQFQGFALHNIDTGLSVTVKKVARRFFERLYRVKGWDQVILSNPNWPQPLRADMPLQPDDPEYGGVSARKGRMVDLQHVGFYWAYVPTGYLDDLDDPANLCFDVLDEKPRFSVWAAEADAIRNNGEGMLMLEEFNRASEVVVLDDGRVLHYDDHPNATRMWKQSFRGRYRTI
jgi:hypothetical protein